MYNYNLGFNLGVLHSPTPYICIVLIALYIHVQSQFFKNIQKDVGTPPAWHPHAPMLHPRDHNRAIILLPTRWLYLKAI